jgi:hypothetical protein
MPAVLDGFGKIRVVAYVVDRSKGSTLSNIQIFKALLQLAPQMKDVCVSIFADRALELHDLEDAGLPHVRRLLCTWHMVERYVCIIKLHHHQIRNSQFLFTVSFTRDLTRHLSNNPNREEIKEFVRRQLVDAPTVEAYDQAWAHFSKSWPKVAHFLRAWHSMREDWAKPFRNNVFNLGFKASSCAEAANSSMKAGVKRAPELKVRHSSHSQSSTSALRSSHSHTYLLLSSLCISAGAPHSQHSTGVAVRGERRRLGGTRQDPLP